MKTNPCPEVKANLAENEEKLSVLNEAAGIVRATEYYQSRGETVIDRNWTSKYGKVELITESENTLVFHQDKGGRIGLGMAFPVLSTVVVHNGSDALLAHAALSFSLDDCSFDLFFVFM